LSPPHVKPRVVPQARLTDAVLCFICHKIKRYLYGILILVVPRAASKIYAAPPIFPATRARCAARGRVLMLDVMYLAIGFGFLAVAVLYVIVCDRL
jgi:hypothetical protein